MIIEKARESEGIGPAWGPEGSEEAAGVGVPK